MRLIGWHMAGLCNTIATLKYLLGEDRGSSCGRPDTGPRTFAGEVPI